jgi:hypothetical protein
MFSMTHNGAGELLIWTVSGPGTETNQNCVYRAAFPAAAPEGGYSGCVAALSKYVAQGKAINDAAAKAAAARAAAAPHVLLSMSGSGIANSAPFQVADSTVTARYSFDCSAFGQSGNFIASMGNGNQSVLGSDSQPIANGLALSGAATTTLYPTNAGQDYHLSVNSECNWSVTLTESG